MNDEEFQIMLLQAFAEEAAEQVQAMISCLIELEKSPEPGPRKELVERIFREAHNLKGSAGAVNAINIQNLCQALESIFSDWKKGVVEVRPESFDLLNRAVDLVSDLLEAGDSAETEGSEIPQVSEMIKLLEANHEGNAPSVSPAVPSSSHVGTERAPRPVVTAKAATGAPGPVSPPSQPAASTPPATPPSDSAPTPGAAPKSSETVRIPVSKMEAVLRQAEEMVATKLILQQHAVELASLAGKLSDWHKGASEVGDLIRSEARDLGTEDVARLVGFLQWNQSYVGKIEKDVAHIARLASRDERTVGSQVDSLLDDAKHLVTLPVGTLFDLYPKMVRDISRDLDKKIRLVLEGREVEIDKRILQEMKDPLIHLVRNSVDHGIEQGSIREELGKPAEGTLTVAVEQLDGNNVEIMIRDDGSGIDVEKVKAKAIRNEMISPSEAAAMDKQSAFFLIFESGVSTSDIVTEISGRGLGMAIVREKVEDLGGSIIIESEPGTGTTFRIQLPVTLATFKAVLVGAGGQTFAIPTTTVEHITRCRPEDIRTVENRDTLLIDDQPVALVRLDAVLELPPREVGESSGFEEIVLLGSGERRIAFAVDSVINELELLVKPIGSPLVRVRNVAGAAILGSGEAVVILNTADLLKSAVHAAASGGGKRQPVKTPAATGPAQKKVLVADDSVTSRMLLKNILESAGYLVTTAIDGMDALTELKSGSFQLLVSDVEMPRMDGFDLTTEVRSNQKLGDLPVVLVTSLSSREHRERGVDVGANAYVVKSQFDQSNLLEIINTLI